MRRRGVLIGLMICLFLLPIVASSTSISMQEEPRGSPLEHGRNRLFFYGIQDGSTTPSNWEVWNHATSSDSDSDNSFSEANFPGAANNGGGSRSFDFLGSAPNTKDVKIDDSVPIQGRVTLSIDCNQCSKEITVELKVGSRTYDRYSIQMPDEGSSNVYSLNFDTSLDELKEGEAISLRLDFTKPAGLTEGYTLNLGSGNFYLDIPTLPEPETEITWVTGQDYISPYANETNSFSMEETGGSGILMSVIVGVLIIIAMVCTISFAPIFPGKLVGTILLGLCTFTSFTIAPIMTNLDIPSEEEISSVDYFTPDKMAELGPGANHEFLAGLSNGSSFTFYVEFNKIHSKSVETTDGRTTVYGLGFEKYSRDLSATATQAGMEQVQLWFSALELDPSVGHAVSIEVTILHVCIEVSPGTLDCTIPVPDTALIQDGELKNVALLPDETWRSIIPASAITIHQVEREWTMIPMYIGLLLGLGTVGIAIVLEKKRAREWAEWQAWVEENGEDED